MQSKLPKVLHRVGKETMIEHLVGKLESMNVDEIFVVVGYQGELVKAYLGSRVTYVEQTEQLGTAHAVSQTAPFLQNKRGETLVLAGDTPLIETQTMELLVRIQRSKTSAGVVLTALADDPTGYGRIIRDERTGEVIGIAEEKDATPEQRRIREVNTGIFCFDNRSLYRALPSVQNHNTQQEYYLTDIIPAMRKTKLSGQRMVFDSMTLLDPSEAIGINTPQHLAAAEQVLNQRALVKR